MSDELYSQSEVAHALGVSPERVRQLAVSGKIKPAKTMGGRPLYARFDVEALAAERKKPMNTLGARTRSSPRTEAAIQLAAFRLFKKGATLEQVMSELEITSRRVRDYYAEWQTPLGKENASDMQKRLDKEHDDFLKEYERTEAEARNKARADHERRMKERNK